MKSYTLVNPLIIGNMTTEFSADNGLEAVSKFWNEMGSHLALNVPKLYITMQEGGSNNLLHYKIEEKINNNKIADYTISDLNVKLSKAKQEKFLSEVEHYKSHGKNLIQTGGSIKKTPARDRSKDSSSSSSSDINLDSEDDYYNFRHYRTRMNAPINLLYYTPLLYNINTVIIPTFVPTVVPYVTIYMPF